MQRLDNYGDHQYNGYALRDWYSNNFDVALYICAAYLAFVFKGPSVIARLRGSSAPPDAKSTYITVVKKTWVVWNLMLSVFSLYGVTRVAPTVLYNFRKYGLHDTLCNFREDELYTTRVGFAMGMFAISKLPEFGDTVFLILQGKRQLPFLQYFHHTSMFLFVWLAYEQGSTIFICAAVMNYAVHTIMYFYFAMAEAGFKRLVKPFAMYITILQLLQMMGAMYVAAYVIYHKRMDAAAGLAPGSAGSCPGTSLTNARFQLTIYSFFLYLFGEMFYNAYVRPTPRADSAKTVKQA